MPPVKEASHDSLAQTLDIHEVDPREEQGVGQEHIVSQDSLVNERHIHVPILRPQTIHVAKLCWFQEIPILLNVFLSLASHSGWKLPVWMIIIAFSLLQFSCNLHMQLGIPFDASAICEPLVYHIPMPSSPEPAALTCMAQEVHVTLAEILADCITTTTSVLHRDFALWPGGSRIIPELTSKTYRLFPKSYLTELLVWLRGWDVLDTEVNPPTEALEDDVRIGSCLQFVGHQNHLGISLPDTVHISDVTITSAHISTLSADAQKQTPQEMIVWGLIDNENSRTYSKLASRVNSTIVISPMGHFMHKNQQWTHDTPQQLLSLAELRYILEGLLFNRSTSLP